MVVWRKGLTQLDFAFEPIPYAVNQANIFKQLDGAVDTNFIEAGQLTGQLHNRHWLSSVLQDSKHHDTLFSDAAAIIF